MLEIGIELKKEMTVTGNDTAKAYGSGDLEVFATPAMISLMELTARTLVQPELETEFTTVGTLVNVQHTAATPVGMKVECTAKLIEIDRKRLVFEVSASDEAGVIGTGIHERFIVESEKFQAKADSKLK